MRGSVEPRIFSTYYFMPRYIKIEPTVKQKPRAIPLIIRDLSQSHPSLRKKQFISPITIIAIPRTMPKTFILSPPVMWSKEVPRCTLFL
jgi:hypothetical protein